MDAQVDDSDDRAGTVNACMEGGTRQAGGAVVQFLFKRKLGRLNPAQIFFFFKFCHSSPVVKRWLIFLKNFEYSHCMMVILRFFFFLKGSCHRYRWPIPWLNFCYGSPMVKRWLIF